MPEQPGYRPSNDQSHGYQTQSQSSQRPDDDYQAASYSTADYAKRALTDSDSIRPSSRRWRWVVIAVILIAAAAGSYLLWNRTKTSTHNPPSTQSRVNPNSQTTASATTKVLQTTTKEYSSTEFVGLSFKIPSNWQVHEASGSGLLTAISPALSLKDASGNTTSTAVLLKIRTKQQPLPEFDKGNAVAIRASEKLAYTQPSASQRGSTYLSFLQFASTNRPGLDGVYITGDVGYQVGQAIPKADLTPIDPVISLSFVACNAACSPTNASVTVASTTWDDSTLSTALKGLLGSLTIN